MLRERGGETERERGRERERGERMEREKKKKTRQTVMVAPYLSQLHTETERCRARNSRTHPTLP